MPIDLEYFKTWSTFSSSHPLQCSNPGSIHASSSWKAIEYVLELLKKGIYGTSATSPRCEYGAIREFPGTGAAGLSQNREDAGSGG